MKNKPFEVADEGIEDTLHVIEIIIELLLHIKRTPFFRSLNLAQR